jgi:hypothetical protein
MNASPLHCTVHIISAVSFIELYGDQAYHKAAELLEKSWRLNHGDSYASVLIAAAMTELMDRGYQAKENL